MVKIGRNLFKDICYTPKIQTLGTLHQPLQGNPTINEEHCGLNSCLAHLISYNILILTFIVLCKRVAVCQPFFSELNEYTVVRYGV